MNKYKYAIETNLSDINLHQCGEEKCAPGFTPGNTVRNHYLLHFILSGKGIYKSNNKTYEINQGEAFLIFPDTTSFYRSDTKNPWQYMWIAFDGIRAKQYIKQAGFSAENPYITLKNPKIVTDALKLLIEETKKENTCELSLIGYTYLFFSALCNDNDNKYTDDSTPVHTYIDKATKYIDRYLWRKITVNELAKHIGLDRSYFSVIFKEEMNIAPGEYITRTKLEYACRLLKTTTLSIAEISSLSGHTDQFSFSRLFRKKIGCTPTQYRNN